MAVNNLNPAVVPPTAAEIASAVAAPSAATIATSVAGAVPTLTQINNSVASNASPFPTWVAVTNGSNFNGVASTTVSGLSAYRTIRFYYSFNVPGGASSCRIRFNSDSGNNYHTVFIQHINNGESRGDHRAFNASLEMGFGQAGTQFAGFIEISNNQSTTGPKIIKGSTYAPNSNEFRVIDGFYGSNSQISTMTLSSDGGNFGSSILYVVGVA